MNEITFDLEAGTVTATTDTGSLTAALESSEGFAVAARAWLRAGWDAKYVYSFTWLGRPVIQLPDDLIRLQELVYRVEPDVIIETGVAHGGSLVFLATLCKAMDRGRVIGVELDLRPQNREAIASHPLGSWITVVDGSSVDSDVVAGVASTIGVDDTVLVLLDSNHTLAHVEAELTAYAPLVSVGSYLVAMDGIMGDLAAAPRSEPSWTWDNPRTATERFVGRRDDFVLEDPAPPFNEGTATTPVTYWPASHVRRIR